MAEHAPVLPGLSPVGGKPVHLAFDAGRLTSDAGVLVLAEIERKLGLAERLARCIEDRLVTGPADLDLALDLIFGPLFYRLLMGHAPITRGFVDQLLQAVIPARA